MVVSEHARAKRPIKSITHSHISIALLPVRDIVMGAKAKGAKLPVQTLLKLTSVFKIQGHYAHTVTHDALGPSIVISQVTLSSSVAKS